jgi:hypothetical protein
MNTMFLGDKRFELKADCNSPKSIAILQKLNNTLQQRFIYIYIYKALLDP